MKSLDSAIMVGWTTLPDEAAALALGRLAVESGLAACAQVSGPVCSIYRWEGKVQQDAEYRLTLKFAATQAQALEALVAAEHPYDVPQWLAVSAAVVAAPYAQWVLGAGED